MKKKITAFLILCLLSLILSLPYLVFAQEINTPVTQNPSSPLTKLQQVSDQGYQTEGVDEFSVAQILGRVVNVFISLLAVIFIIIIILAGYKWLTANGSEEKVKAAQDSITRGVIGLIIILSAWAIWTFIAEKMLEATLNK